MEDTQVRLSTSGFRLIPVYGEAVRPEQTVLFLLLASRPFQECGEVDKLRTTAHTRQANSRLTTARSMSPEFSLRGRKVRKVPHNRACIPSVELFFGGK